MIKAEGTMASLEFAICINNKICVASYYERSYMSIKSISAALSNNGVTVAGRKVIKPEWMYHTFMQPIACGKDKFYHALAMCDEFSKSMIITTEKRLETDFYNYLMNTYNYPLLRNWAMPIFKEAERRGYITVPYLERIKGLNGNLERKLPIGNEMIRVCELIICQVCMKDEDLRNVVSDLLKEKRISICSIPQKNLEFKNMDEYFAKYGKGLVDNLEKQLNPLAQINGNMTSLALNNIRLMPPQAAQVNGLFELMRKSKYGIQNMGMGTGKTITSVSAVEGYFNRKSGRSLFDIYSDENSIKYRNVVMCPGHLVEKWKKEIENEVPYAKVTIIDDFSALINIRKNGKVRTGREWFIIGKDFAKLGYQSIPVPKKEGLRAVKTRECAECSMVSMDFRGKEFECKYCGSHKFKTVKIRQSARGMICPFCNNVLIKNRNLESKDEEDMSMEPLTAMSFATQNTQNERCHICGEELWQPHVANYSGFGESGKGTPWYRATYFTNKSHKGKKTVWVHEKFADEYFEQLGELPLNEVHNEGVRKYPPAQFIKKKLKGYFDFLILDELHLYKGGTTAQGNAMHALIKSSKKVLGLTGTIAGGMATDLFYILYRLDPARMQMKGYAFSDVMKFAEKYGSLESIYEFGQKTGDYNKTSRGKQLQAPRPKPGISPLIFADFLMDKTVFLDLSDMSDMLPEYKEIVETVSVPEIVTDENGVEHDNKEAESMRAYGDVLTSLKEFSRGQGVLGTMLQFALSYPDKPYGVGNIVNPYDGTILKRVPSYDELIEDGKLLAKERRLVEIVKSELSEGRNCVIYAEFTGKGEMCVTHRLKEVLAQNTGLRTDEIVIIESSNPPAKKREEWMHKKAREGVKVFITNPKCVETGLDFVWKEDNTIYNFPTLIFCQLGYSLFTIWQASRRAYRLIQKEECRTYYMAYKGTLQETAIQLIAEKQVATSAIQGKFSAEGLSAMANGIDARVRLAQALSEQNHENKDLQRMFDTAASSMGGVVYENVQKMKTVSEILGTVANKLHEDKVADTSFDILNDLNDMFEAFQTMSEKVVEEEYISPEKEERDDLETLQEMFGGNVGFTATPVEVSDLKKTKRDLRMEKMGQISLFGIY